MGQVIPLVGSPARSTGRQVGQVRGILADRIVMSTPLDPWLSLKALAAYSGLSVRRLRDLLADPAHPLPYYRIGGKILVRRSEYDGWIAHYRQTGPQDVDRAVAEVLTGLRAQHIA